MLRLLSRKQQAVGQQATGVRLQRALEDAQRWKAAAQQAEQAAAVARRSSTSGVSGDILEATADAGKLLAGDALPIVPLQAITLHARRCARAAGHARSLASHC